MEKRKDLGQINTIIYSVAVVFTFKEGEEYGIYGNKPSVKEEPAWKQRLARNIARLRKETDILNSLVDGKLKKKGGFDYAQNVMRKYGIDGDRNSIKKAIFVLKNKISALASKLKRYETQEKSKRQNDMFMKNRKQFYREIEPEAKPSIPSPPSEADLREFWGDTIFGQADLYDSNAEWIPDWRQEYRKIKEQEWSDLSLNNLSSQLSRQLNWKSPGIDLVPNYWLKTLDSAHSSLTIALNECVLKPQLLPQWLVTGRTSLLPKNAETNKAKNYRPITCLTTTWKTLTGILATKIEKHLEIYNLLANEQ